MSLDKVQYKRYCRHCKKPFYLKSNADWARCRYCPECRPNRAQITFNKWKEKNYEHYIQYLKEYNKTYRRPKHD